MPKQFTIRGLMIAVAAVAVVFAYASFAISDYSAWEPESLSVDGGDEYTESLRHMRIIPLAAPLAFFVIGLLFVWVKHIRPSRK